MTKSKPYIGLQKFPQLVALYEDSSTVDASLHAPSLEKQRGALALRLSNLLLWMGSARKAIFSALG